MTRECTIFEYESIIIPLHKEMYLEDIKKAKRYPENSIERQALLLAAQLKELHVEYLILHIIELKGKFELVKEKILKNKARVQCVNEAFLKLNVNVNAL